MQKNRLIIIALIVLITLFVGRELYEKNEAQKQVPAVVEEIPVSAPVIPVTPEAPTPTAPVVEQPVPEIKMEEAPVPDPTPIVKTIIPKKKPTPPVAEEIIPVTPVVEPEPEKIAHRQIDFIPNQDFWNLSALYGAKFMSVSQTGDFRKANFGSLTFNNIRIKSEFVLEDWAAWVLFDTYKFKSQTLPSSEEKQMASIDLGLAYKWMMGGVSLEQNPIFRSNAGRIDLAKLSQTSLFIGAKKNYTLPTLKPTTLNLMGAFHFPFSSQSDESEIKVSSFSGYGLRALAELNRQILLRDDYSLHATWQNELRYLSTSQTVKWDGVSGKIDSTYIGLSIGLGLLLKF